MRFRQSFKIDDANHFRCFSQSTVIQRTADSMPCNIIYCKLILVGNVRLCRNAAMIFIVNVNNESRRQKRSCCVDGTFFLFLDQWNLISLPCNRDNETRKSCLRIVSHAQFHLSYVQIKMLSMRSYFCFFSHFGYLFVGYFVFIFYCFLKTSFSRSNWLNSIFFTQQKTNMNWNM